MDFFFGGFLASRFGAFLFPMPTASHRFEDDARGQQRKRHLDPHFFPNPESVNLDARRRERLCFRGCPSSQQARESRLIFNPLRLPNTVTAIRSGWNSSFADTNKLSTVTAWMRSMISSMPKKRS